jgi:hypothetical protein
VAAHSVRIGRVELPRRAQVHPLVPDVNALGPFCIDPSTAAVLEFLAYSLSLADPCLLEGPTSTSKTSSVRYLASLIGQPLARLNLNGQTDTGELIGRFTPAEAGGWIWREGLAPRALRDGLWLLIDEVNLAEAQIVERLNSMLDQPPSLVLTEHANEVIADPDPGYWLCATANPAGRYVGRSPMSPAFRDRFVATLLVAPPSEEDYLAYLRLCVFGLQPAMDVGGCSYGAAQISPLYARLANVDGIEAVLVSLAKFHAAVVAASASDGADGSQLAGTGEESPTFTRRGLAACLRFLASCAGQGDIKRAAAAAIGRYYLDRVASDRTAAIRDLAQAAGLPLAKAGSGQ